MRPPGNNFCLFLGALFFHFTFLPPSLYDCASETKNLFFSLGRFVPCLKLVSWTSFSACFTFSCLWFRSLSVFFSMSLILLFFPLLFVLQLSFRFLLHSSFFFFSSALFLSHFNIPFLECFWKLRKFAWRRRRKFELLAMNLLVT